MANPPPSDGIADDFFDQLFSMPTPYAAADTAGMALQLGFGENSSSAAAGGFQQGPVFPLCLSLDQGSGGVAGGDASGSSRRLGDDDEAKATERNPFQLASLFPAFGNVHPHHQIRHNLPPPAPASPPAQVFNSQMARGGGAAAPQPPAPRPRVRARRGQATDPHSIAERLRRERIAERLRALQELVPNTTKTDRAAMLDEILDYVKFLRLQVKVLSMSRLGGTGAVAQLVADIPLSSHEGDGRDSGSKQQVWEKWSTDGTERQVAKLMDEDVGAAMQFLQSKALCIMPIQLASAIYHTHPQPDSPSVKHEPNTPS